MALILKTLYQGYFFLFEELPDPRANEYHLMSSPFIAAGIAFFYLYFVYSIGPNFMANRQPYNIENYMRVYNMIQVLSNCYLLLQALPLATQLNWICSPVDYSDSSFSRKQLNLSYCYFILKVLDLLDTVFFILRKNTRQITFLHVYHHFGMVCLTWGGVKFLAGGHSLFLGFVNIIVHIVMYFYYLLTSFNSEYKKSLWWKKYITQLQLFQFAFLLVMYSQVALHPTCSYPKFATFVFIPQNLLMLLLFGDFYYKSYVKPGKQNKQNGEIQKSL